MNYLLANLGKLDGPIEKPDDADKNIADTILEFYGIKCNNQDIADFLADQIWYPPENSPKLDEKLKTELLKLSGK